MDETPDPVQSTRVVSLVPSATEILDLLGMIDRLVGRSHECDFPPSTRSRPVLTGQVIPADLDPGRIDAEVRARVEAGLPLYTLDAELLQRLAPTHILTQDLCHVCSIDVASVRRIAAALPAPPAVVSLNPTTFEGVLDSVLQVGSALGSERRAMEVVARLRERVFSAEEYVNPFVGGPSVAFLEWTEPLFVGGHWVPQMIERAGGRHVLNPTVPKEGSGAAIGPQMAERVAGKSVVVTPEQLQASEPEWVIVCPCGVGLAETRRMAEALSRETWWKDLPAVRAGRVVLVDGNQMFARPGPRLVEAYEFLVGLLNDRPHLIPEGFPAEFMPARG